MLNDLVSRRSPAEAVRKRCARLLRLVREWEDRHGMKLRTWLALGCILLAIAGYVLAALNLSGVIDTR